MCDDLIENVHFRIPQENWHKYPAWLLLCIHEIIAPVIALFAIAMKILMKKEMKRYLLLVLGHLLLNGIGRIQKFDSLLM